MATDFAEYANIRILWSPQPVIEDLRSGVPAAADLVVIEAFVSGDAPADQNLPSIKTSTLTLGGYITRFAALPAEADWLAAGSSLAWDDTGLAPAGLRADTRGRAIYGDLTALPTISGLVGEATVMQIGGRYGIGGIGAELRGELGDKIRVQFAMVS